MSVELIINGEKVEDAEARLDALITKLQNRTLKLSFTNSQGEAVEKMKDYAATLEELGDALEMYVTRTASALRGVVERFETELDGECLFGRKRG